MRLDEEKTSEHPEMRIESNRDLTKGSISLNVLSPWEPIVVNYTIDMMSPITDMIWVGRSGIRRCSGGHFWDSSQPGELPQTAFLPALEPWLLAI
jgi:hypothetical protein